MVKRADWPVIEWLYRGETVEGLTSKAAKDFARLFLKTPLFDLGFLPDGDKSIAQTVLSGADEVRMPFGRIGIYSEYEFEGVIACHVVYVWDRSLVSEEDYRAMGFKPGEESSWEGDLFVSAFNWVRRGKTIHGLDALVSFDLDRKIDFAGDKNRSFIKKLQYHRRVAHKEQEIEDMHPSALFCLGCVITVSKLASRYHAAVSVSDTDERVPKKAKFKQPWLRESLPHVVFLSPNSKTDCTGAVVRGGQEGDRVISAHRRRGHYKTLRAERFKHKRGHRVWVRPAWVGPREWAWEGVTYKVVTK